MFFRFSSYALIASVNIFELNHLYPKHIDVSSRISPADLRKLGRCPLTPEEAALVLAGLGFKRGTYIYLAGSHIYGGKSRMDSFTSLFPNLVTKETLLTSNELAPLKNFSSQVNEQCSLFIFQLSQPHYLINVSNLVLNLLVPDCYSLENII